MITNFLINIIGHAPFEVNKTYSANQIKKCYLKIYNKDCFQLETITLLKTIESFFAIKIKYITKQ